MANAGCLFAGSGLASSILSPLPRTAQSDQSLVGPGLCRFLAKLQVTQHQQPGSNQDSVISGDTELGFVLDLTPDSISTLQIHNRERNKHENEIF